MAMHWNTRHWWFHRALHTMFYCFGFIFVSCTPISQPSAELSGTPPDQKDCTLGGLPETLVYGNVAHQSALAQLTSCQRQALIMDAEGMAVSWPQRAMPGGRQFASGLIKQTLRGLLVPRQEIEVLGVEWVTDHYDPVTVPTLLREIETSAGFQSSGDRVQIPIHPTTQKQHPLIQKLIDKGHPVRDMGQVTATMSRSLWNTKPAGSGRLVTIKMGSDFVHGTKSPNKLLDVGQDIKDLETQTLETSIADYMATLDVGYLVDQAAVTIKDRSSSDKAPDYTVAMRDYTSLLQDRHRIYMPQYLLFKFGRLLSQGPGTPRSFILPYSWGREIRMSEPEITKILDSLNEDMARVIAIHHANGYMPLDFHAQNVMVGIPLSPDVRPRLVFRDVADIYPFDFPATVRERRPGWPGIKTVTVDSLLCYEPYQVQLKTYADQMKKMGFPLPGGSWDRLSSLSLNGISYDYFGKHQDTFWAQVKKVRGQRLDRRCGGGSSIAAKAKVCRMPTPAGKPGIARGF